MRKLRAHAARLASLLLAGVALVASGCGSRPDPAARRMAALPPQIPLSADGKWFAGSMLAHVTVDPAQPPGAPGASGGAAAGADRAGAGGGFRVGMGGGRMGGGGRGNGGGGRDGPRGGDTEAPRRAPLLAAPRQMLQITLTNLSGETVDVAVTDLESALGNFAVRPEHLTLAPAESASVNPMFAGFPDNLEELDVTLALKIKGQTERQTLRLKAAPAN